MKILVIKQTSLGDVLHATGHIRTIKQTYPDAELYLLTATSSAEIYRHNPWVDHLILFDRYGIKRRWRNEFGWALGHIKSVLTEVRQHEFELAFDLQGLARSVLFLYFCHSKKKYVKGRWWGLNGFRNRELHAIEEMDAVLKTADIVTDDTTMEFAVGPAEIERITSLLVEINANEKPLVLISPFSRWRSKDWPLAHYVQIAKQLSKRALVCFTGTGDKHDEIARELSHQECDGVVNLSGKLNLTEFAALCQRGTVMVTGDSFPMHVASAQKLSLVALFGPTDENKVGPKGSENTLIRAPGCMRCDNPKCIKHCLKKVDPELVIDAVEGYLN